MKNSFSANFDSEKIQRHGTRRYLAPEFIKPERKFDFSSYKKGDIYCLSLVFWEIISRTRFCEDLEPGSFAPAFSNLGPVPAIDEMYQKIAVANQRPDFPGKIEYFKYTLKIISI